MQQLYGSCNDLVQEKILNSKQFNTAFVIGERKYVTKHQNVAIFVYATVSLCDFCIVKFYFSYSTAETFGIFMVTVAVIQNLQYFKMQN